MKGDFPPLRQQIFSASHTYMEKLTSNKKKLVGPPDSIPIPQVNLLAPMFKNYQEKRKIARAGGS